MDKLQVAFVDDGINPSRVIPPCNIVSYIVMEGEVVLDQSVDASDPITHGTICLNIFNQYIKCDVEIISIKILNQNKICSVETLITALNWVKSKAIRLINLSLGTSCFQDKEPLKQCINDLANDHFIMIAAQNNMNYASYPAAFSNVIGVSAAPYRKNLLSHKKYLLTGVDFSARSRHSIPLKKKGLTASANSFAAPYVTALVANLYTLGLHVSEIKQKLSETNQVKPLPLRSFDWCHSSILIHSGNAPIPIKELPLTVNRMYDARELALCRDQIKEDLSQMCDTLIISGVSKEINRILNTEKEFGCRYLLILVREEINSVSMNHSSKTLIICNQKLNKIFSAKKIKRIQIPVIIVYYSSEDMIPAFQKLRALRNSFHLKGYHCTVFSEDSAGILYGFESWMKRISLRQYIDYFMVDLMMVAIDMKKGANYIKGDIILRFGIAPPQKEFEALLNINEMDVHEYLINHLS